MTASDLLSSGLDAPLSLGSTLWESTKEGAVSSFGLGTALRSMTLPPEAPISLGRATGMKEFAGVLSAQRSEMGTVTEEQYKSSASFRESIPWDRGMTEERAKALAEMDDVRKVREFYAAKRPVTAFMGKLAGGAADPINYIPIFGEYVVGANVARFGYVAGRALTASADAMANTAIAGLATAPARSQLGDDVSWQSTVSQIALAGLIGAGFGTAVGVAGARRAGFMADATDRLATLKRTQESRVVLNDAIDALARNGRVELSPTSHGFIERAAADVTYASRQGFEEPLLASVGPAEQPRIDEVTGVEGFTVYHGSPHTFDRFSMEHIGKGEGAQAYGHGLYFAENEGVAKGYRDQLAQKGNKVFTPEGGELPGALFWGDEANKEALRALKDAGSYDVARTRLKTALENTKAWGNSGNHISEAIAKLDDLEKAGYKASPGGSTYEVRIRANPEDFLDWDKPLSEQSPKVREALNSLLDKAIDPSKFTVDFERGPIPMAERHGGHTRPDKYMVSLKDPNGQFGFVGFGDSREEAMADAIKGIRPQRGGQAYERLAINNDGSPAQLWGRGSAPTSDALRQAGIPGIRYLDQGSRVSSGGELRGIEKTPKGYRATVAVKNVGRTKGPAFPTEAEARKWAEDQINSGTRNFVVFDDSLLHTIRRNDEFIAKQPQDLRATAQGHFVANGYMPEDFIAEPNRAVIDSQIGKPDNLRAIAEQYRVNPETGEFPEQAELDQIIAEGRLSEEDAAMLKTADDNFTTATAFGDALKAAMTCVA